jgi:hypothetical protein
MRASGVLGLLIYCSDFLCRDWTAISGDPNELSEGLQLHWLGVIFQDENPHAIAAISKAPINAFSTPHGPMPACAR